eukprot:gene15773-18702_t
MGLSALRGYGSVGTEGRWVCLSEQGAVEDSKQRYERRFSWKKDIFPRLRNFTDRQGNLTSVGNCLINQYLRVMLKYEWDHPADKAHKRDHLLACIPERLLPREDTNPPHAQEEGAVAELGPQDQAGNGGSAAGGTACGAPAGPDWMAGQLAGGAPDGLQQMRAPGITPRDMTGRRLQMTSHLCAHTQMWQEGCEQPMDIDAGGAVGVTNQGDCGRLAGLGPQGAQRAASSSFQLCLPDSAVLQPRPTDASAPRSALTGESGSAASAQVCAAPSPSPSPDTADAPPDVGGDAIALTRAALLLPGGAPSSQPPATSAAEEDPPRKRLPVAGAREEGAREKGFTLDAVEFTGAESAKRRRVRPAEAAATARVALSVTSSQAARAGQASRREATLLEMEQPQLDARDSMEAEEEARDVLGCYGGTLTFDSELHETNVSRSLSAQAQHETYLLPIDHFNWDPELAERCKEWRVPIIDPWNSPAQNEFMYINDWREDVMHSLSRGSGGDGSQHVSLSDPARLSRQNVHFLEVNVRGWPHVFVVVIRDIGPDMEAESLYSLIPRITEYVRKQVKRGQVSEGNSPNGRSFTAPKIDGHNLTTVSNPTSDEDDVAIIDLT